MESRLEVLVVTSVMEVFREEIVGLVKTWEVALEPSDKALKIPSPAGHTATSLIVFRRRSNGFIFESSSDDSSCSANGRNVVGLIFGDTVISLPPLPSGSKSMLGMFVSEVFLLCLVPIPRRSAGVFACGRLSVCVQLDRGEEYGGKLAIVPDRSGVLRLSVARWDPCLVRTSSLPNVSLDL